MSAIGLRTPAAPASGLRGPVRVLLRQHRRSLWAAGALVALGVALVVGLRIWVAVASSAERCADGDTTRCGDGLYLTTYARTSAETFLEDGGTVILLLAALIGAFVAGPLIARELESGTYRMAWTQSVSPTRWLVARLTVPAALATAGITVLVLVYRWGRSYLLESPYTSGLSWHLQSVYPAIGPVAVGYAALATAVGALTALVVRRTVLSLSAALLVMGVVVKAMERVRADLWPTDRFLGGLNPGADAWLINGGKLTASSKELLWEDCYSTDRMADPAACMRNRGGITDFLDAHPASHFWPLQLVETGILLVLAAAAVALAFRVLRRRHG